MYSKNRLKSWEISLLLALCITMVAGVPEENEIARLRRI